MKRKILITLMITIILLSVGCNKQPSSKPNAEKAEEGIVVYTSIYPMYDFAEKIGKDKVDLRLMVPPGAEPHDWEPTAKLMAELENADVIIYNGLNMETWIDRVIKALGNEDIIIVKSSEEIDLLKLQENHSHEEGEEHNEEYHGDYDPHVWLDPIRAIKQGENIKDALVKADKKNKSYYEENFNEFQSKLKKLDEKYREELQNIKSNEIVVAHAAFGYLADRYGLEQISISGLTPQEEPSAAKMARVSELVKDHNIKYIFFESLTSPRLAEVLANETGAEIAVLNPVGGVTEEEIKDGKDYISIMEENLEALKKALQ